MEKMKITHSIKEYIQKNEQRKNAHWRIQNGKWYFDSGKGWKIDRMFSKFFPKYQYVKFNIKGENPNKKLIQ